MKHQWTFRGLFILVLFFLVSCQRNNTVCSTMETTQESSLQLADLILETPVPASQLPPSQVEIGGKTIQVDKLVDYPICNDSWSGIVYVNCDAQVADVEPDEESNPLFFKGCDLKIEPGTIVYVAAHNDTAYYKGCSCHTGELPEP